jgi:hypothetical protein
MFNRDETMSPRSDSFVRVLRSGGILPPPGFLSHSGPSGPAVPIARVEDYEGPGQPSHAVIQGLKGRLFVLIFTVEKPLKSSPVGSLDKKAELTWKVVSNRDSDRKRSRVTLVSARNKGPTRLLSDRLFQCRQNLGGDRFVG